MGVVERSYELVGRSLLSVHFCQLLQLLDPVHLNERLQLLLHLFLDLCDYCQLQRQLLHFLVRVLYE